MPARCLPWADPGPEFNLSQRLDTTMDWAKPIHRLRVRQASRVRWETPASLRALAEATTSVEVFLKFPVIPNAVVESGSALCGAWRCASGFDNSPCRA
jgi:hypothetical protein